MKAGQRSAFREQFDRGSQLEGKGVELVVDLSRVIKLKDFLGAADDLIKFQGCLADLRYDFGFCRLNDLFSVF